MKKSLRLLSFVVIGMIVLVAACKPDPPPVPTAEELRLEELAGTSSLTWNVSSVTLDGTDQVSDWTGFTLTFTTTKTYSTSNSGDENVWPANGTWDFDGPVDSPDVDTIVRSDNIPVSVVNISETSMQLSFDYVLVSPAQNARTESIEGTWVFGFTR